MSSHFMKQINTSKRFQFFNLELAMDVGVDVDLNEIQCHMTPLYEGRSYYVRSHDAMLCKKKRVYCSPLHVRSSSRLTEYNTQQSTA